MAWNDPATLNLVASLLIVVVMARVATDKVRWDLWWFGLYALAATSLAVAALLLGGHNFQAGVYLFGVAAVAGAYWTAASRPIQHVSRRTHAVAAGASIGLAAFLTAIALAYRWWIAPLTLLVLMGVGLVVNGVVPMVRDWRGRGNPKGAPRGAQGPVLGTQADRAKPTPISRHSTPRAKAAAPVTGTAAKSRATPPSQSAGSLPPRVPIRCPSCGLQGRVKPDQIGKTVACPGCKARVVATMN